MNTKTWLLGFYAMIILLISCNKDEKKDIVLSELQNSADSTTGLSITYGLNGDIDRIDQGDFSIQFFDVNGKLAYRKTFSNGSLQSVDSVFSDNTGKILKADTYDDSGTKESTTNLSYNSNNTLNTVTIDFVNPAIDDASYEYTYTNGTLSQRLRYRKVTTEYRLVQKDEILSYDDRQNPWEPILMPYLVLNLEASAIIWAGPKHNPSSLKSSTIDPVSGAVTNVTLNTITYGYDENDFPSELFIDGVSTYKYKYIEK